MFMVPTGIFLLWLLGIWFYGLIIGGLVMLHRWFQRAHHLDPRTGLHPFHPALGWNGETALLIGGIVMLLLPLVGGVVILPIIRAFCRKEPADKAKGTAFPAQRGAMLRVPRADGSEIQVEMHGPETGAPIVLSHGWGTNRTEWEYLRRDLSPSGYRLITWEMPGLGDSSVPANRDYSLENLASDLDAVTQATCGSSPVILAGHSIGGMTTLTFCRDFPEELKTRVAGIILVNTTYTNPVRTVKGAPVMTALEKPLLIPLQYLTIPLSPLFRMSNWMSYFNGMGHVFSRLTGFAGTQSWEELDMSTRYTLNAPPAVIARGQIGMTRYDATAALASIPVPTLIVSGDKDVCCKHEASELMEREIPEARLVTLSPANHMGLMEHHTQFAEVVGDFVAMCFSEKHKAQVH